MTARNRTTCASCEQDQGALRSKIWARRTNGIALSSMKTLAVHSIAGLLKKPMPLSWEEKPPVAMAAMAWPAASKPLIPSMRKAIAQMSVMVA